MRGDPKPDCYYRGTYQYKHVETRQRGYRYFSSTLSVTEALEVVTES